MEGSIKELQEREEELRKEREGLGKMVEELKREGRQLAQQNEELVRQRSELKVTEADQATVIEEQERVLLVRAQEIEDLSREKGEQVAVVRGLMREKEDMLRQYLDSEEKAFRFENEHY